MNEKQTLVAIDPGMSGGIAVFTKGRAQAVNMPEDVHKMQEYLMHLKNTYENIVVFIEKVQAFVKDDDAPGKKFAINKMLANYEQILTVVKLMDLKYVEVFPNSWQSTLGLRTDKSISETKAQRKARYKIYAQKHFPEVKVNMKTCDALCLIRFALVKIEYDMMWIRDRIQSKTKINLL
jgi:hypothetical protein